MRTDPVLLEILANKSVSAAVEMATTLQRTARTIFVKEAADFACALVGVDGRVFAHPPAMGVGLFVDMDATATIEAIPDLEPGDVILTNDPWDSGSLVTHLPDLTLVQPYFHDDRIVAYGWAFIHSTDIGGITPGSVSPIHTDVYQEGIRIPPVKLVRRGETNADIMNFIKANCRIPVENEGDILAMLAGLRTGEQRVAGIIDSHGVEVFLAGQEDLLDYSEAKARAVFRRIPDGTYEFWNYMDDDLLTTIPVRVRAKMTVEDGRIHVDVTGTDPQVRAAYNICAMDRMHEWLTLRFISFVYTYDPTIILNHGVFRPITMTNPRGTVLNADFPGAVAHRDIPARRFNTALTGAFLKAVPDLMAAPSAGAAWSFVIAEYADESSSERKVGMIEPMRGGTGAFKGGDGCDARDNTMSNMSNHPVEFVEADHGVIVRAYDVRPDSGGPGRWRGGVGQMVKVEIMRDGTLIMGRSMEWLRFVPWGTQGGRPSLPFRIIINEGCAEERILGKFDRTIVNAGDTVTVLQPGGGGYGDPYLRESEKVLRDERQGFVTRDGAARDYGVVIADDGLDREATKALRKSRPKDNVHAEFDFGPEREAWEAVFDDETMNALNVRLFALPASVRWQTRRRIFETAVPNLSRAAEGPPLDEVMSNPNAIRARFEAAVAEFLGEKVERAAE